MLTSDWKLESADAKKMLRELVVINAKLDSLDSVKAILRDAQPATVIHWVLSPELTLVTQ